jgi:UDP-2,4-diacetamido-2,4,6-trideoxy-beta-L-altropyranose hydrolase
MIRAVIRVDASNVIGSGHVMRCLTLASSLRERGAELVFVCRNHAGNLCGLIEQRGFAVRRLPLAASDSPLAAVDSPVGAQPAHAAWLGSSWEEDAAQTQAAIGGLGAIPDWLIVDHYALDERWESSLCASVRHVLVIDDLADRNHHADLLLDQNLVEGMTERYADRVPKPCRLLLGPDYALLQPQYAALHQRARARTGPIRRLFVFFGGSDEHDLTDRAMTALLRLDRKDVEIDVVLPNEDVRAEQLRRSLATHAHVRLHADLPSLAELMAAADVAIGAGGVASWERLCLGLPALVVSVAENQRAIAEELDRRGLIRYLGHHDRVDEAAIGRALAEVLAAPIDEEWSRRCLRAVDGRGAERARAVITTSAATPLRARRVVPADDLQLLAWANDPVTRQNAFHPEKIPLDTHRRWLAARLENVAGCRFYIVETGDAVPIGTVRFEASADVSMEGWEVHFSLAPDFRGRGLGLRLLETALAGLRADGIDAGLIFGQVKEDNSASRKIFEGLAFARAADAAPGILVYRRAL